MQFDGQQSDEQILYELRPHAFARNLNFAKVIALAFFFCWMIFIIAGIVPVYATLLKVIAILSSILLTIIGVWWNQTVFAKSVTYITDRRIYRFDIVSPFFTNKRALFWTEALKAKGYQTNFIYRMMNIGSLQVLPQAAEHDDVSVPNVYMYEDVANYIDKILFTIKNNPKDIADFKPFVAKGKGKRG